MGFSDYALDTFVAQQMSTFIWVPRSVGSEFPNRATWLDEFVLRRILHAHVPDDRVALALITLRRILAAIEEWESMCVAASGATRRPSVYFSALQHCEGCVAAVWQALEFGRKALDQRLFDKGDGTVRDRLANALETGYLAAPYSMAAIRSVLGSPGGGDELLAAMQGMERRGLAGTSAAAFVQAVSEVTRRATKPDIVWSGPEVPGLHARDTRRVFEELLSTAERSIWASTYAFFDGPKVFDVLSRRMEARPDLQVILLLNIERRRGDTSAADQVVRRFAERFWRTQWPGTARPRVFYDPRSVESDGLTGVLHAKAVVADDETVLVTSANLTEAALDRNIELGLLVRDRALAASVTRHFQVLIDRELLRPLPMA